MAINSRVKFFRDRISRAVRTRDESGVLNAVAELSKDPDLMGEVISGDEAMDSPGMEPSGGGSHQVTINVHPHKASDDADPPGVPTAAAPAAAGGEEGGGDLASQIAALTARMDQIEQVIAMLADEEGEEGETSEPDPDSDNTSPPEEKKDFGDRAATGDSRATVGDSTSMREGFQRMLSQAEILMPGIQLLTFDSASPARTTFDAMCSFRRRTLEASKGTEKGKAAITAVLEGDLPKSFHDKSMTCDAVSAVFNAAAGVIASQNSGRATQPHFGPNGSRNGFTTASAISPAELNKRNAAAWANR